MFNNGILIDYSVRDFNNIPDTDIRINEIKKYFKLIIEKTKPFCVCLEDIQYQRNQKTYKFLAQLQGVLINYLVENTLYYQIIHPNSWKSYCGIKIREKRNVQKQQSIQIVKNMFDISVSDDEADAILMNIYVNKLMEGDMWNVVK